MTTTPSQPGPPSLPTPADAPHLQTTDHAHAGSTLRSPRAWTVLLLCAILGLAADLGTKAWAFRTVAGAPVTVDREEVLGATSLARLIPPHTPVVVAPRLLEFTLVLNPGAVFGIGAGKRAFFIVVTGIAIVFAGWMFAKWTRPQRSLMHAGIGLLIAGALGNLYDRILYACVRDFIHPLPGVKVPFGLHMPNGSNELWPYVSNVADLFLLIAIAILLIQSWRTPTPTPTPIPTPVPKPAEEPPVNAPA